MCDQAGEHELAVGLIGRVIEDSVKAEDTLTEAWARLVLATMAMEGDDWQRAREECRLARAAIDALEFRWWVGATLRLEAMIIANDAAFASVEHGWQASTATWQRAIEAAAEHGSQGELALTLRCAASVAARLGHDAVALALLDAAPTSTELGVLPELFHDELRRLEQQAAPRVPPPRDIVTVLHRARDALAMDPSAQDTVVARCPGGIGRAVEDRIACSAAMGRRCVDGHLRRATRRRAAPQGDGRSGGAVVAAGQ